MRRTGIVAASIASIAYITLGFCHNNESVPKTTTGEETSTVSSPVASDSSLSAAKIENVRVDSIGENGSSSRYTSLTEEDYRKVAEELGIEIAAMKAVVLIEAGKSLEGFWAPGVPVINFDRKMYNSIRNADISGKKAPKDAKIPDGIRSAYGRKEWGELIAARKVNEDRANMGTFWGMFQIGGFNYRKCGCKTIDEFVELMSYSELEQLELFAAFITNTGMLKHLRNKNWAAFARMYNGASYARRGYHTRMARAYQKYKNQ